MAKAIALTPSALNVPPITPKAATPARTPATAAAKAAPAADSSDQVPLQVRIPRHEARAIKIAAAERDQTISEFMLSCFHASMEATKHV